MIDSPSSPPAVAGAVQPRSYRWVLIAIIALALLLRVVHFPHADEYRDVDESGYLQGSLAMLEGLPAGYKAAPAGPNFWIGWVYSGGVAAFHFLHPGPEERAVPLEVRPFVAVNHALFDQYRDLTHLRWLWIGTQMLLMVLAIIAAFQFGKSRGGLSGGVLVAGYIAVLPMFVDFTDMSRPYMTAWCFGLLSLYFAACVNGRWRMVAAGVFLGLSIASRIEMLLFAPLVLWEFWHRHQARRFFVAVGSLIGITAVVTLLTAPWLVTHLIGQLRTIATVRFGPNPFGATTLLENLKALAGANGLAVAILAGAAGVVLFPFVRNIAASTGESPGRWDRLRVALLAIYVALLLLSLGHGTIYLHQQGPVVLALITFGTFAAGVLDRWFPRVAPWVVAALLLLPLGQSIWMVVQRQSWYVPDPSVAWVEAHVPSGTIVYTTGGLQNLLPTEASATALWSEVTDDHAWRAKFQSGLERFHLQAGQLPRALSDENLVQERGNRRGYFILGGRADLPDPRYDLRLYNCSPVFGVKDPVPVFLQTGGVLIWKGRAYDPSVAGLVPAVKWTNRNGDAVFIFCSDDVKSKLKP